MDSSYPHVPSEMLMWIISFLAATVADFAPQVHWSCSTSTVSVFVQSPSPFKGLISTREATASECRSVGVGTNVAVLKLALKNNYCGVRYNNELDQYVVTIEIHSHSIVIVDEDVVLNVTCKGNRKMFEKSPLRDHVTLSVQEQESGRTATEIQYSNAYVLAVESASDEVDFRVGNCTARNENNRAIELTDSRGCSLYPSLVSSFIRAANGWYATVPSMFRFPSSTKVTFSCQVIRCGGGCTAYPCGERNSVTRRSGSEADTQTESLHTTILLRDKPEAVTAMQAYEQPSRRDNDCDISNDSGIMCTLCITLSAFSLLGFALELVLYILLSRSKCRRGSTDDRKLNTEIGDELKLSDPRNQECPCYDNRRNSSISDSSLVRAKSPNRVSILMEYSKASGRSTDFRSVFCCAEINPNHCSTPVGNPEIMYRTNDDQAVSYL